MQTKSGSNINSIVCLFSFIAFGCFQETVKSGVHRTQKNGGTNALGRGVPGAPNALQVGHFFLFASTGETLFSLVCGERSRAKPVSNTNFFVHEMN